jgi:8-oxo-dGTP pyrophosphatase MutT (NUDIX family)
MHKIVYFNNYKLTIANDISIFKNGDFKLVLSDPLLIDDFEQNPDKLFNGFEGNIGIYTPLIEDSLENIISACSSIVAAGGLVTNEENEILCIYRKGFWDLPKGKVDQGEKIIDAAVREVEEETGVVAIITNFEPTITYHTYVMNGQFCIKETYWYSMKANINNQLKPQLEEDITAIEWINSKNFEEKKELFYPLISGLISNFLNLSER